jgi:hypothetical protein
MLFSLLITHTFILWIQVWRSRTKWRSSLPFSSRVNDFKVLQVSYLEFSYCFI